MPQMLSPQFVNVNRNFIDLLNGWVIFWAPLYPIATEDTLLVPPRLLPCLCFLCPGQQSDHQARVFLPGSEGGCSLTMQMGSFGISFLFFLSEMNAAQKWNYQRKDRKKERGKQFLWMGPAILESVLNSSELGAI